MFAARFTTLGHRCLHFLDWQKLLTAVMAWLFFIRSLSLLLLRNRRSPMQHVTQWTQYSKADSSNTDCTPNQYMRNVDALATCGSIKNYSSAVSKWHNETNQNIHFVISLWHTLKRSNRLNLRMTESVGINIFGDLLSKLENSTALTCRIA